MPKVSFVEVEYGRSTQPKQYESAKANVKIGLSWDAEEDTDGLDDAIADAFDTVQAHVHARLNIPAPVVAEVRPETPAKPAENKTAKEPAKAALKKAEKPAKPKTETIKETADGASISDEDMQKAVMTTMQRLSNAGVSDASSKIMALLKAYISEPPYPPSRVPEDKRTEFVEKLKALS